MTNEERVVGIDGKPFKEPPVTQIEQARVARLQAAAWNMHTEASIAALEIGQRIARGAEVEPGEWNFDPALNMVRSTRQTQPPDAIPRKEPESAGAIPEQSEAENAGA